MAVAVSSNGVAAVAIAIGPRWSVRVLLAVVSGCCLAAAFPSLDCEPLAWVGLVPLLVAARGLRPRRAFVVGWLGGVVFYLATVYWITYTITRYTAVPFPLAAGLLVLMTSVLACYHGAFVAGLRWFDEHDLPVVWLAPPLWVTLEWLRGWFFIGFPWAALGYSQYRYHDLVQMAEVTGVYGISALLVLFNVVVATVLGARGERLRACIPALLVLTALVAGVPVWGRWRANAIASQVPAGRLRVGIVQGNVAQDQKWDLAYQRETLSRYADLTAAAAGAGAALVVWPETATPFFFQEPGPMRQEILDLAVDHNIHLLFGSPAARRGHGGRVEELNRAYLVSPAGRELATYDKIQLVPFGEYVPYRRVLFFVDKIVAAVGTIVPGLVETVFRLPGERFGVLICYEDVFPALTRRFVAHGADFLVNVTNDAWYGPTSAPYQHLAQATFRAVENRVPLVRAANTGISALIEPDGRIRWQSPLDEPVWHVDDIAWPAVRTVYTRFGDLFAHLCALASLGAFGYGARRAWRRN